MLELKPKQNKKYSIIIPAAGLGSRMKKYGPKSLIKINKSETILDRQLKLINRSFRWYEIILITGFQHDKLNRIANNKIRTVYNKDYDNTNVIHSINLGLKNLNTNNVLILYGDLVFNENLLKIDTGTDSCAIISDYMKAEEIGCNIHNNHVQQMFYDIPNKWAQILFLTGLELNMFTHFSSDPNNTQAYGFEGVNYVINKGGSIRSIKPANSKVIDIDSYIDLKTVRKII